MTAARAELPDDPGVAVLASYLDRALRADPSDYALSRPTLLCEVARAVAVDMEKARAEYAAVDRALDDLYGGLL